MSSPTLTATIEHDLPCIGCGYNLRTQPRDGRCPECGLTVEKTLAAQLLAPQIQAIRRGAVVLAVSLSMTFIYFLCLCSGFLFRVPSPSRDLMVFVLVCVIVEHALWCLGAFLISPRLIHRPQTIWRYTGRAAAIFGSIAIISVWGLLAQYRLPIGETAVYLSPLAFTARIVATISFGVLLYSHARRLDCHRIAQAIKVAAWCLSLAVAVLTTLWTIGMLSQNTGDSFATLLGVSVVATGILLPLAIVVLCLFARAAGRGMAMPRE